MGNYNFDTVWDRWSKDAKKWDMTKQEGSSFCTPVNKGEVIPMWIADMDFATAPSVIEALEERIKHPLFGYFDPSDRYINAIASWQSRRFGTQGIKRENILYHNSVLGGVASAINAFTQPGDYILVNQTTYTGFQDITKRNGRYLAYSNLVEDKDGIFRMDFADMERKIVENNVQMMIFCSPHNPTGRVWEKEEIEGVVNLADKYNIMLLSDEIWADFVMEPGKKHIPTQSVSDRAKEITMAMYAPSKTFNLAGLLGSYSVIYNKHISNRVEKIAGATHYNGANVLSVAACYGAYEGGEQWLEELLVYVRRNQEYMYNFFTNQCKGVKTFLPQGTYLLWVDVEDCGMSVDEVISKLTQVGVIVNDGRTFQGKTHLRFNLACPMSMVVQACERMENVFNCQ